MKRTNWILLSILTYLITLIYVLINRPLYSKEENLLKAVPHFYWILLALNSVLLTWLIFDYSKRNKLIAILLSLMYGFLFYITNLHFIIPYEQTDTWSSTAIDYMLTSGRITHKALSNPSLSYLSYPISFILETAIMVVGDINKIGIYTIGLFTFMGIFYVGLLFYYHKIGKDMRSAVLSLATYIILSFYVINDQVAPQTLALALIPYLYRLTFDYMERKGSLRSLTIIIILYFALVFPHPFMFLFYVLPILGVILYYRTSSRSSQIKGTIIWVFLSVWGFGFIYLFYNLLSIPLRVFIERFGEYKGETWWVFANFLKDTRGIRTN